MHRPRSLALAVGLALVTAALPLGAESARRVPSAPLAPLDGQWLEGFGPLGYVSPPTGSTEPRPVVVAIHGRNDVPERSCSQWRAVFGPRPFIVCPRGAEATRGYAWTGGGRQVRDAVDRLLDAAAGRYGAHLDRAHRIYAGFSQGAIVAGPVICDSEEYPFAILQEGFPDDLAKQCGAKPGKVRRVILGCSQGGCSSPRQSLGAALARDSVDARVNDAGVQGHVINGVIVASLKKDLPWLLEGAPEWLRILGE
jgi:hypothetical protein